MVSVLPTSLQCNIGFFQELYQMNGASIVEDTRAEFLTAPGK